MDQTRFTIEIDRVQRHQVLVVATSKEEALNTALSGGGSPTPYFQTIGQPTAQVVREEALGS